MRGGARSLVRRCLDAPHRSEGATAGRSRPSLRRCDGQSSVELIGAIPLLLIVVLTAAELLAAGAARVSASSAADAAAMAVLQGGDPAVAARSAAPGWAHARIAVQVSRRHARVRLAPPSLIPGLSSLLSTTAEADAGPAPQASALIPAGLSRPTAPLALPGAARGPVSVAGGRYNAKPAVGTHWLTLAAPWDRTAHAGRAA